MSVTRRHLLLAGAALAVAWPKARAAAVDRTLWLQRPATGEEVKTVYAGADGAEPKGYLQLCRLLRDLREEKVAAIDLHLLDLMWTLQQRLGGGRPLEVLSGYRTAATNAGIEGAALNSLHLQGRAVDLRVPGIGHDRLLHAGLLLGSGGVGDYRDFIHLDTGRARRWNGGKRGGGFPAYSAWVGGGLRGGVLDNDIAGIGTGLNP